VLNKLGALIYDPDIRLMLAGKPTSNFKQILDQKLILLVNLPKCILGEGPSALLGAFIVAHLQKAALSRAANQRRQPYYLYLDEFQNYTTDNIKDILSESRKYALSLTLVHQYLDQLSPDIRAAVLNTAGTLICFRVGYHDAYQLVKEIFPSPDFITEVKRRYRIDHLESYPLAVIDESKEPLKWEGLTQILTKLRHREFWCRRRGNFTPTKHKTFDMLDPVISTQIRIRRKDLIDYSGRRFGRLKTDIKRELNSRYKDREYFKFKNGSNSESDPKNDDENLWGF